MNSAPGTAIRCRAVRCFKSEQEAGAKIPILYLSQNPRKNIHTRLYLAHREALARFQCYNRRRGGRRWLGKELNCMKIATRVFRCKFFDFNELVYCHAGEMLTRFRGGPQDIERHVGRARAQTNILLDRIGAEGTGLADRPVDRTWRRIAIAYGDVNLSAQSLAIGL